MTCEEFIEALPDLEQAEKDGNKWCIVYFSKQQDSYRGSYNLDSGDALIVIEELVKHFGIDPMILATMERGDKPFVVNFG